MKLSLFHYQGVIHDKEDRIFELEEALRESIKITAQREVVMHEQQMKQEHGERVVRKTHTHTCVQTHTQTYA